MTRIDERQGRAGTRTCMADKSTAHNNKCGRQRQVWRTRVGAADKERGNMAGLRREWVDAEEEGATGLDGPLNGGCLGGCN